MKGELCYKCRAVGDETFKNCNCILNWNEIKALAQKFYVPIWKVLFALFYLDSAEDPVALLKKSLWDG